MTDLKEKKQSQSAPVNESELSLTSQLNAANDAVAEASSDEETSEYSDNRPFDEKYFPPMTIRQWEIEEGIENWGTKLNTQKDGNIFLVYVQHGIEKAGAISKPLQELILEGGEDYVPDYTKIRVCKWRPSDENPDPDSFTMCVFTPSDFTNSALSMKTFNSFMEADF